MRESEADQVLRFIDVMHEHLVAFARRSFAQEGRGLIRVTFPAAPVTVGRLLGSMDVDYRTAAQIRGLMADVRGRLRRDAENLMRMVDTYDPERQAVITASVGHGNPIALKMKLARTVMVDEAQGVH